MTGATPGGRGGAAVVLLLALVLAALLPWLLTQAPQDDSYITYQYARNLAEGHGLVFNAGEPPVEGYTNFLWTVLLAGLQGLGQDIERLAPLLGLACTVLCALWTAFLARALGADRWWAALAALLFAVRPALTVHAMSGLETMLFTWLVLVGVVPRLGERRTVARDLLSAAALAAAALTRPEGVLVFALLEGLDLVRMLGGRRGLAPALCAAAVRVVPFVVVVGAHVLWRHSFYGEWLPNTYYAKVAPSRATLRQGALYVAQALAFFGPFFFLPPWLLWFRGPRRAGRRMLLVLVGVFVAYVVGVGGDYIPGHRFLVPWMPWWCALAAVFVGDLAARMEGSAGPSPRLWLTAVFALVAAGQLGVEVHGRTTWAGDAVRHRQLCAAGRELGRMLPPHARIAVTNAGRVAWFSRRPILDMMGLADAHIAHTAGGGEAGNLSGHQKGDGRYVLDQAPAVILFLRLMVTPGPLEGDPFAAAAAEAFARSEAEVAADPRFREEYEFVSVDLPEAGCRLNLFRRRD